MKKKLSYFASEGLLIVFSILLALGLNEWRQHAAAAAEAHGALADITAELNDTHDLLIGMPAYHRTVAARLRAEAERVARDGSSAPAIELFLSMPELNDSIIIPRFPQSVAWEVAKDRGVTARFDDATARLLAQTYGAQLPGVIDLYTAIAEQMFSAEMHATTGQAPQLYSLSALFGELASREVYLNDLLDRTLEEIGAVDPEADDSVIHTER